MPLPKIGPAKARQFLDDGVVLVDWDVSVRRGFPVLAFALSASKSLT